MLPLFIIAVVALCLTVDCVVQNGTLARTATLEGERVGTAEWLRRALLVPAGVVLAPGHVWLRPLRGGLVRLGADALPAALLGEPDRVTLPAAGARIARGQVLGTLARGGREIALRAPIDGVVARVQGKLGAEPDRVAKAPFGGGWLVELRPAAPLDSVREARAGGAARGWLRDELDRMRDLVVALAAPAEGLGATALDGGAPLLPLSPALDDQSWARARELFFPAGRAPERWP